MSVACLLARAKNEKNVWHLSQSGEKSQCDLLGHFENDSPGLWGSIVLGWILYPLGLSPIVLLKMSSWKLVYGEYSCILVCGSSFYCCQRPSRVAGRLSGN
jgi:hypothetical protein